MRPASPAPSAPGCRLAARPLVLAALGALGCGSDAAAPPAGGDPPTVSYRRDVQPIWESHCMPCHYGQLAPADTALATLLGEEARFCRDLEMGDVIELRLVEPGDPWRSVLWRKLADVDPDFGCGREMPPLGIGGLAAIDPDSFATVERWILEGARDE